MTDSQERRVRAESWRDDVSQALQEGYTWLYQLTAIDGIGGELGSVIEILLRLEDSAGRSLVIQTAVPRDRAELPAIDDLIAGAAWYQREVHDQFGVVFTAADMTPLLVHPQALADHHQPLGEHQSAPAAPLRKDVVLTARATTPWPGNVDDGAGGAATSRAGGRSARSGRRRRGTALGVPDAQTLAKLRAGREVSAEDIVSSMTSGRRRRR